MAEPIISWMTSQNMDDEITSVISYGTVESDSASNQKAFYIWNNRNGDSDVATMEECVFITKDREGGTGDTPGKIVEAVRDNWIQVRVDTLDEEEFTAVGKDGGKAIGTNGSTKNPNAETAVEWSTGVAVSVGDYIKPTVANDFIYKVTVGGTTDATEPSWSLTEGAVVNDDAVQYTTIPITKTPAAQEILGVANSVLEDGSNASDAGGNFVKLTAYADVPVTAGSGKNSFIQRVKTGSLIQ